MEREKMTFDFQLRTWPDPILKEKCETITLHENKISGYDFTVDELRKQMIAFVFSYNGLGLAANQIGVKRRMVVMRHPNRMEHVTTILLFTPV